MLRRFFLLPLCILLLFLSPALAEDAVTAEDPGIIKPCITNTLTLRLAEAGELTVRVYDEYTDTLLFSGAAEAGEKQLLWQGRKDSTEPLPMGHYTLEAVLKHGGSESISRRDIIIGTTMPALVFALPSSDVKWAGGDDWRIDYLLTAGGDVQTELLAAGDTDTVLRTRRFHSNEPTPAIFRWDGTDGGQLLPEGDYIFRFSVLQNTESVIEIPVTLKHGAAPIPQPVTSGICLPAADASDAEIWAAMMQPITVVNINPSNHLVLMDAPSGNARRLGMVHGQSQGLIVLEEHVNGYAKVGAWRHEDGIYIEGYVRESMLKTVVPNEHWGILIDKRAQTLSLWHDGARLGTVSVCTGLPIKGAPGRETRAGAYLALDRQINFSNSGYRYHFAIRISGGDLIHSTGSKRYASKYDFSEQQAALGQKLSHGCVRTDMIPGEGGVCIYDLWIHIPYGTKVLVLDDPAERAVLLQSMGLQPDTLMPPADRVAPPADSAPGSASEEGEQP